MISPENRFFCSINQSLALSIYQSINQSFAVQHALSIYLSIYQSINQSPINSFEQYRAHDIPSDTLPHPSRRIPSIHHAKGEKSRRDSRPDDSQGISQAGRHGGFPLLETPRSHQGARRPRLCPQKGVPTGKVRTGLAEVGEEEM
jgi:hypothetical protein